MNYDAQEIIDTVASLDDAEIDLGLVSIALAALDQSGISMDRYIHHLKALANDTQERYADILKDRDFETLEARLQALCDVIGDQHGYVGDNQTYDDLQNANLIRVIERSKGIPITLAILYICTGRALGWDVCGLNIPGHFVCRIEYDGKRLVFDPFDGGKILEAPDLRMLVKRAMGERAELSAQLFEAASNRDIILRLQNNIKHRQIEAEDYEAALLCVQRMLKIAPDDYRLLLDAGVLYAKVEQTGAAIDALEGYISGMPKAQIYKGDARDAQLLLEELKGRLN